MARSRSQNKQQKGKAYFSRYQVKYKRRREGKTDYYARKRLITQAKNKYSAPKFRLVVRFTNKDIICQITQAKVNGDYILAAAYSHELPHYGIKYGLTNWTAAYATGLLVARRALKKVGLDKKYEGVAEPDGEFNITEANEGEDERKPLKVYLDVGLKRTTTGSKLFGALKGASDGGLHVPHSESRFPGYDPESKELDAETLRKYIFGGHVAEYMEELLDDDEERYQKQFSQMIADDFEADGLEDMYQEAYNKIREDPSPAPKENTKTKEDYKKDFAQYKDRKLNKEERKARVAAKIKELTE